MGEQIKKLTAFMGWFNLTTCGQSYNLLFLQEEPLIKFSGACLTVSLLFDSALLVITWALAKCLRRNL